MVAAGVRLGTQLNLNAAAAVTLRLPVSPGPRAGAGGLRERRAGSGARRLGEPPAGPALSGSAGTLKPRHHSLGYRDTVSSVDTVAHTRNLTCYVTGAGRPGSKVVNQ